MPSEGGWVTAASRGDSGGVRVAATRDIGAASPGGANGGGGGSVLVVAAHSWLGETTFKGGAHSGGSLYKTRMCSDWSGLTCPRGVRCDFAHGAVELRSRKGTVPAALATLAVELTAI